MRIMFWNINALLPTIPNFKLSHGSMLGFLDFHGVNIAAFQETKLLPSKLTKELACIDGFESFWAMSRNKLGYSGVVTYVRKQWSPVGAEADCLGSGDDAIDREGRVVVTDHGAFVLLNVYVPNAGDRKKGDGERVDLKCRFLAALKEKADSFVAAGREVIIVGDLNIAASQMDVHHKYDYSAMYSPEEKALLQDLLRDYHDTWRELHPDVSTTFTVWDEKTSARVFNEGVRIDYALVSGGLRGSVKSCEVVSVPPKWSDHACLVLELEGVEAPGPHPPCPLSSACMRQFNDRSQRSLTSLFKRKRDQSDPGALEGGAGAGSTPEGAAGSPNSVQVCPGEEPCSLETPKSSTAGASAETSARKRVADAALGPSAAIPKKSRLAPDEGEGPHGAHVTVAGPRAGGQGPIQGAAGGPCGAAVPPGTGRKLPQQARAAGDLVDSVSGALQAGPARVAGELAGSSPRPPASLERRSGAATDAGTREPNPEIPQGREGEMHLHHKRAGPGPVEAGGGIDLVISGGMDPITGTATDLVKSSGWVEAGGEMGPVIGGEAVCTKSGGPAGAGGEMGPVVGVQRDAAKSSRSAERKGGGRGVGGGGGRGSGGPQVDGAGDKGAARGLGKEKRVAGRGRGAAEELGRTQKSIRAFFSVPKKS
eukprot:jgi/Botrbrau1/10469/Bobra.0133s0075.1